MKVFFLLVCMALFSRLSAQTPGYSLARIGLVPLDSSSPLYNASPSDFEWVASNNTSTRSSFFIYDVVPNGTVVQSIRVEGISAEYLGTKPSLPAAGPTSLLVGPFDVNPGLPVTFHVSEVSKSGSRDPKQPSLPGEAALLIPRSLLASRKNAVSADAAILSAQAGTPEPTETSRQGSARPAQAVPNISRGGQPIDFIVDLDSPGVITLSLYSLMGERVYSSQTQGSLGRNDVVWNLHNGSGAAVAAGLYLYWVEVSGKESGFSGSGKVIVLH